ncbi:MAG: hypothetical protein LQ340_003334, partial [Diploschistes diacapsis]
MADYETERQANIQRNKALIKSLGLTSAARDTTASKQPPVKKRKTIVTEARPTRSSARIASAPRPTYTSPSPPPATSRTRNNARPSRSLKQESPTLEEPASPSLEALIASWSSWTLTAPPPIRDE